MTSSRCSWGLAATTVLASCVGCETEGSASRGLRADPTPALARFLDRPPAKEDAEAIAQAYRELTGSPIEGDEEPWFFASVGVFRFESDDARFALIRAVGLVSNPGVSSYEIFVFDAAWKQLARQWILTGYRMEQLSVDVVHSDVVGADVLVARTTSSGPFFKTESGLKPAFAPEGVLRQYVGYCQGNFHLLRVELDNGEPLFQSYRWSRPMMGPPLDKLDSNGWLERLRSADVKVRLGALGWLLGQHLSSKEQRHANVNQESVEDSKTHEAVLADPSLDAMMSRLEKDPNAWIRACAPVWDSLKNRR